MRLKPHAIDIRVSVDPVHYFLNEKEDTRSSYYLEDAATEFQVQGLELDWVCVAWCGDFRFTGSGWSYHDFRGNRWCNIANPDNRIYLRNAYRVLLTRARQGMVVFVPPGDASDPTRSPAFFDSTFDYLGESGFPKSREVFVHRRKSARQRPIVEAYATNTAVLKLFPATTRTVPVPTQPLSLFQS